MRWPPTCSAATSEARRTVPESALQLRSRQTLAELLNEWELSWLIWPSGGALARQLAPHSAWQATLSASPALPLEVLERAAAFLRVQDPDSVQPLVLVLENSEAFDWLPALRELRRLPDWLVVIWLDSQHTQSPVPRSEGWFGRSASSEPPAHAWTAWIPAWNLESWGSCPLAERNDLSTRLEGLLQGGGRRLLHIFTEEGAPRSAVPTPLAAIPAPTDSVEGAALDRLLALLPERSALLWCGTELPPTPFSAALPCRSAELASAAWTVHRAGGYPVVLLPAHEIARALPGCLDQGLPPGCLLLVLAAALTWSEGESHLHPARLRDLCLLRQIHGLAVACPADVDDAVAMAEIAFSTQSPLALRLTRSPAVQTGFASKPVEAGRAHCLRGGLATRPSFNAPSSADEERDADSAFDSGELPPAAHHHVAILTLGDLAYAALLAAEALAAWGVECQVWDMRFLRPLDREALIEATSCGHLLTVEEHCVSGGLATAVLETLAALELRPHTAHLGLPAFPPIENGALAESFGLDADGIGRATRKLLGLAQHLDA